MALLATGVRLAIGVWIGAAGLVNFLLFIFIICYLAGRDGAKSLLPWMPHFNWLVVLKPHFSFEMPPRGETADLVLMEILNTWRSPFRFETIGKREESRAQKSCHDRTTDDTELDIAL
jgi:hypothetical protein